MQCAKDSIIRLKDLCATEIYSWPSHLNFLRQSPTKHDFITNFQARYPSQISRPEFLRFNFKSIFQIQKKCQLRTHSPPNRCNTTAGFTNGQTTFTATKNVTSLLKTITWVTTVRTPRISHAVAGWSCPALASTFKVQPCFVSLRAPRTTLWRRRMRRTDKDG